MISSSIANIHVENSGKPRHINDQGGLNLQGVDKSNPSLNLIMAIEN